MANPGLLNLVAPTKLKADASGMDDAQSQLLQSLASGDISGALSTGDKLIALSALLRSVSRGSKTTPQEVMQNLQQSKLQEMQNKIQLQQLQSAASKEKQIQNIIGGTVTPGGAPGADTGVTKDAAYYYGIANQLAALGDTARAEAYRKQGDSISQYTPQGRVTNEFAAATAKAAYDLVDGMDPVTNRPMKLPRWKAEGAPSPMAWIAAQAGGPTAAPTASPTPEGTVSTMVNGRQVNVPVMSSPVGAYQTGLSEGEKTNIQARGKAFEDLLTNAQSSALAAQQRLPQIQAMSLASDALATGKLAGYKNAALSYLDAFGLSNDPNAQAAIANAAAFTDLRKRNVGAQLANQKGASSDKDLAYWSSIGSQITNTPAGNRLISATEAALARRDINFNNFLGRYKGEPGQAMEAWGKTRQGRLGILGDADYVKAAISTGVIKLGEGIDKRTNKKVYFVQTKNGNRIFLN